MVLTVDDDGPGSRTGTGAGAAALRAAGRSPPRDVGGSGLGLSIVDEVVRAHGGSVSIEPSPLGGARIQITLPVQAAVS